MAAIPSQAGRRAVITGTAGLGFQTALQLAGAGAEVIMAGRNERAGEVAVGQIRAAAQGSDVRFELVDLASLASVASLAERLESQGQPIDILVCNAGVMSPPQRRTTHDGFELQFGVNHLGHFALVGRVLPLLRKAAAARVVSVTSLAQNYAKIDFDNLQSEQSYVAGKAYCLSKFAQASFARTLQSLSEEGQWGVNSMAAHPGLARTDLFQADHAKTGVLKNVVPWILGHLLGQSAEAGAACSVYAAASPEATGGELYGPQGLFQMKGPPGLSRFARATEYPEIARRLWAISEELTGVEFPRSAQGN